MLLNPYRFGGGGGGGTDPYFSSVKLLNHFNGTNGSTSFPDNSASGRTATAFGNAQITTSGPLFGTGALLLDGTGDYITYPASSDFDFGALEFAIELSVCPSTVSGLRDLVGNYGGFPGNVAIRQNNGKINFLASINGASWFGGESASDVFTSGSYTYCSLTRDALGVFRLAADGVVVVTDSSTALSLVSGGQDLRIGTDYSASNSFAGKIDELRITKGASRSYAVPSAQFPDS